MLQLAEIEAVLDQVTEGDRDAFLKIVHEFNLPLRSFIASQVQHMSDVDDLTQEVFIAAYRNLHTFQRNDNFGAWLRGIARNKLSHYFRSMSRRSTAMARLREDIAREVQSDLERAASTHHGLAIETLLGCIGRLPEKMRRVVRAGLDGEKVEALAGELLTSTGAIYNLHYRANQLLRECLERELE
ncbi:sigma-70 family RNA polymerase sigma factor [Singulisphaera acidiphila]|uniref:RNA polymerase sigma factor n=1 Tax=Singulisphaera acidiphila (strain ATCC BAA-1392 / DSM 18658 / VKM B-2454 / MOB10) TaxID=886293 RepID=L0DPK3_SINAD|nr:sigma-70 family RNA polymerase sigma factor [Singulisphaera acidiphila]AGA31299.1 RNA polymerase sigma factor, sigma-70 family [Singulisphaera acidiphila DSM 18658]